MQRFKKLGVFLHDSPSDESALAYAGVWARLANSDSLLVAHVHERDDEEEDDAPHEQAIRERALAKLPADVAKITTFKMYPGTGVPEILRSARDDELDLLIVGRRIPSEQLGIGSAFARLARKAPCNVLVVPAESRPHLGRVFVPTDFSRHSKLAVEQAIAIARASGTERPQLAVHTNFTVGYGHTKLGMDLPEAIAQREQVAQQQLDEFLKGVDTAGFEVEKIATCSRDPQRGIQEAAVARKMDLIVVGSRGHSSVFLLGSTTESVVIHSMLPVLVVKEKGETVSIIDALFGTN
jgi:nucleotide-binding universal stress UspA family protein